MRKLLLILAVLMLTTVSVAAAQEINCGSGFSSTGACGVNSNSSQNFFLGGSTGNSTPGLDGSRVRMIPTGASHVAIGFNWRAARLNVQAFTATFTFVPNGQNFAFVINNSNNNPHFNGSAFNAGAGGHAGFFQAHGQPNPPNNVFAMLFDSYNPEWTFTGSNVSIYQSNPFVQCPVEPCLGQPIPPKFVTTGVPLNSPATTIHTTTGHTYQATVTYDGSSVTLNLTDTTTNGSFTHTWTGVNIPASVGNQNTAWVGFTAATGLSSQWPLTVGSLVYTSGTAPPPSPTPAPTATATAPPPIPTPTATATPAPSTCSFTSPLGTVTWECAAASVRHKRHHEY